MLDTEYHNTEIYFCSNGISDGMKCNITAETWESSSRGVALI